MRKWRVTCWVRGAVYEEYTVAKTQPQALNNVRWRLRQRGVFVGSATLEAEELP